MASLASVVDDALKELQQHPESALSLAYETYKKDLRKTAQEMVRRKSPGWNLLKRSVFFGPTR